MTVTNTKKDPENLTFEITSEFDASIDRVWRLWEDPRQLERWWGPPTHPATVVEHDLAPGGEVKYYMTGPEGDSHWAWMKIVAVDAPSSLDIEEGFADDQGEPNPDMPTALLRVDIVEESEGNVRMTISVRFPSLEAMEQMMAMGMDEGIAAALGQIDDILLAGSTA